MRLGSGLILSIAITLGFTFGVSVRGDEAASELKKTSLDTSKQTTFQLTPRIKATRLKSEENGVTKIQFESGSSRLTAAYLRGATAYSSDAAPMVFVVQEFYASDEDRLLIYDWGKNPVARTELAHPDAKDMSTSIMKSLITIEACFESRNPVRR